MKNDCLFCAIAGGEIPSNKVYEDELCYAFYDISPQAPTHFLVIPKAHIASVAEVDGGNSAVVAHIFEVIARLCREKGLESYRVVSNIGEQAGQSVHHLHFHVLSGRDMVQIHAGWNDHHQKEETGQSELQHSDCLLFVSEFLRMHQSIQ